MQIVLLGSTAGRKPVSVSEPFTHEPGPRPWILTHTHILILTPAIVIARSIHELIEFQIFV